MPSPLYVGFWNLENLFDTFDAPRDEKLQRVIGNELRGWDASVLANKISQLAKVIRSLNQGLGPDILGVCEVENRRVLVQLAEAISLPGREYQVVHADTNDHRGIDVAFLYDSTRVQAGEWFQHWVVKRLATRDLFQVNFKVSGRDLICIGNHWPSRSGGQYESEPYRMTAGETLAYWIERICQEKGNDAPILCLGDFNDEPFNRSLMEYALATNDLDQAIHSDSPHYLFNLMWPYVGQGAGSLFYGGRFNMLDQALVSRGIFAGTGGWVIDEAPRVEALSIMGIDNPPRPRRHGRPAERGFDPGGFSDHFPIGMTLTAT